MYTIRKNQGHRTGVEKSRGKGHCLAERFVRFLGQRPRRRGRECSSLLASRLVYRQSIEGHTWGHHSVLRKCKC